MTYKSMMSCIQDLEKEGELLRITDEVDPYLEAASIHRKIFSKGGPAIYFENIKGSPFPAISNLFGTEKRWKFIFRKQFETVKNSIEVKADPEEFFKKFFRYGVFQPLKYLKLLQTGIFSIPKKISYESSPVVWGETTLDQLPQIVCWPKDGGAFLTLPQVYSRDVISLRLSSSNLGMYRVQISGNNYLQNKEVGIHYQIHRGIGIHHEKAIREKKDLPVSIFIGGPPAHTVAAVMPMPESMSELMVAGMLSGRRFRYCLLNEHLLSSEADFCITGWIRGSKVKPEGPFGDHLGYYSLKHDFPVLDVHKVFYRKDAVFPFTVVGRPPQEDSSFGQLIHSLTKPMVPKEIPGVKQLHAVDEAGVHPLLLAIGSERYTPYKESRSSEILTQANAILGFNQCSLAKFLFIVSERDNPSLDCNDIQSFLKHLLERINFESDLHFQTQTTIDTLDYSGEALNEGSKVIFAACGPKRRNLSSSLDSVIASFPQDLSPQVIMSGIISIKGEKFTSYESNKAYIKQLCTLLEKINLTSFPLIVLCDDSKFCSKEISNFLWVAFTRANPSHDIYGVFSFIKHKHWGCSGSLIIDCRIKPHHAFPLESEEEISLHLNK